MLPLYSTYIPSRSQNNILAVGTKLLQLYASRKKFASIAFSLSTAHTIHSKQQTVMDSEQQCWPKRHVMTKKKML